MYCRATFGSFQTLTETDSARCLNENPNLNSCQSPTQQPSYESQNTVKTGRLTPKSYAKFYMGDLVNWSGAVTTMKPTVTQRNYINKLNKMKNELNQLNDLFN